MPEPTKKCPYCQVRMPTGATRCFSCDKKVGPANRFNIAKKPFNWYGYAMTIISGGAFFYFMYWLFFLKDSK